MGCQDSLNSALTRPVSQSSISGSPGRILSVSGTNGNINDSTPDVAPSAFFFDEGTLIRSLGTQAMIDRGNLNFPLGLMCQGQHSHRVCATGDGQTQFALSA